MLCLIMTKIKLSDVMHYSHVYIVHLLTNYSFSYKGSSNFSRTINCCSSVVHSSYSGVQATSILYFSFFPHCRGILGLTCKLVWTNCSFVISFTEELFFLLRKVTTMVEPPTTSLRKWPSLLEQPLKSNIPRKWSWFVRFWVTSLKSFSVMSGLTKQDACGKRTA